MCFAARRLTGAGGAARRVPRRPSPCPGLSLPVAGAAFQSVPACHFSSHERRPRLHLSPNPTRCTAGIDGSRTAPLRTTNHHQRARRTSPLASPQPQQLAAARRLVQRTRLVVPAAPSRLTVAPRAPAAPESYARRARQLRKLRATPLDGSAQVVPCSACTSIPSYISACIRSFLASTARRSPSARSRLESHRPRLPLTHINEAAYSAGLPKLCAGLSRPIRWQSTSQESSARLRGACSRPNKHVGHPAEEVRRGTWSAVA